MICYENVKKFCKDFENIENYNDGTVDVFAKECPTGFKIGRLYKRGR